MVVGMRARGGEVRRGRSGVGRGGHGRETGLGRSGRGTRGRIGSSGMWGDMQVIH